MEIKPFYHEMIVEVLNRDISKKYIAEKTNISVSSIRRILIGEQVELTFQTFRKLLYLYCAVVYTKSNK